MIMLANGVSKAPGRDEVYSALVELGTVVAPEQAAAATAALALLLIEELGDNARVLSAVGRVQRAFAGEI